MLKSIYTFSLLFLLVIFGQALTSSSNRMILLPLDEGELNLPELPYDYSTEIPLHVQDFILGWGIDNDALNSINDYTATLGRVLFYDVRLSGDNSLSCGSCHKQALSFSDDKAFSEGIGENITTRNTMPLNDLGWQVGQNFFWDFRAFSLEEAVIQPILATHELGKQMPHLITKIENAEVYAPLFVNAFGDASVTENRIATALTEFINSMVTFNSRFDQSVQELITLSDNEIAGQALFNNNCSFCHITPHFGVTDPMGFFPVGNNGLDSVFTDLGLGGWTGDTFLNGVFRAPSLRNTEVTAPYMHDGRFETLEEVIDFYSEDVIPTDQSMFSWIFGDDFTGYHFSEEEKVNLLAFLKTLTDENLLTDDRWSNPWATISTSVSSTELQNISVYPNPTYDQLIIELNNLGGDMYNISIYDARGQLVKIFSTQDSHVNIERGSLASGMYELRISEGTEQRTFKVIFK